LGLCGGGGGWGGFLLGVGCVWGGGGVFLLLYVGVFVGGEFWGEGGGWVYRGGIGEGGWGGRFWGGGVGLGFFGRGGGGFWAFGGLEIVRVGGPFTMHFYAQWNEKPDIHIEKGFKAKGVSTLNVNVSSRINNRGFFRRNRTSERKCSILLTGKRGIKKIKSTGPTL